MSVKWADQSRFTVADPSLPSGCQHRCVRRRGGPLLANNVREHGYQGVDGPTAYQRRVLECDRTIGTTLF